MNVAWYYRWRWLAGLLLLGVMQRLAPWVRADEPSWFSLNGIPEPNVGLEVDGSEETMRINGVNSVYDTLFITPTVGLKGSGSIYHPNLLAFDFDGDLGWGLNQMTTTSPGYRQSINEYDVLDRYLVDINLLQEKPYNASFFASQDHTYRDYGSFDTFTVDSTEDGGRINWNSGDYSINTDFGYRDETDTGLIDSSEVRETYFNFVGINKRKSGQTTLTASWEQFDNILNFGSITSQSESVGIADSETFGSRQQITAATGVSYSHADYADQKTDTINATENVNIHHTPNIDSFLVFDYQLADQNPASDTYVQSDVGVRHQLYESLTSTLDVHGSYQDNSAAGASSSTDLYGIGLSENYVKRLQSWGHLTMSGGIVADHVDDSATGSAVGTIDETHQVYLPTSAQYRPVYLNQPQVIASSIQVTAGGQLLVEGSDYEVIPSGDLTEIRLITPPSSHLQQLLGTSDNLAISVSYQSDSAINASYEQLTSNYQIRLDLFGRFGIYGRMNWLENDAPPIVLTQTLTDFVGGVDYNWRWLRAGAEYEDYDSNYSQYTALRFFQSANFNLDRRSNLSLNLDETFYDYAQEGDQTLYQLMTRYSVKLWSSLSCYVQGGASLQDVFGTQQVIGSAQTGFSWSYGKLSVRAGYEYNSQSIKSGAVTENLEKDRVFLYLKRTF
ncbi:MAG TPA: hypothetical protein VL970_12065 [Candidatus Acidoferrales bacterium]|nr:hypothetical protein [Candidatus Acidoferrales bacterium]